MGRGADRNKPCACGSGLKHKRCCGAATSGPQLGSHFVAELEAAIRDEEDFLSTRVDEVLRAVNESTRGTQKWADCPNDIARIECLMETADEAAAALLQTSGHSRQFWYQLLRWGAPVALRRYANAPSEAEAEDGDFVSGATVSASALPVRHLPATAPHEWIGGSGNGGIRYTLDSAGLAALVALSFLGAFRHQLRSIYRIAAKGVPIQLGPDRWTIHSATSDAILSYERRRDQFETDLGRAGFWWEPRTLRPLRPELCGLLGCLLVRGAGLRVISDSPRAVVSGRYLPTPVADWVRVLPRNKTRLVATRTSAGLDPIEVMLPYDALLAWSPRAVDAAFGATPEELMLFLYALYRLVSRHIPHSFLDPVAGEGLTLRLAWPDAVALEARRSALSHLHDACMSGFVRASPTSWMTNLVYHADVIARSAGLKPLTPGRCRDLFDRFTLGRTEPTPAGPHLFTLLSERTLVLDLLHASDFLYQIFLAVGAAAEKLKGATRSERRAGLHEEHAAAYFSREIGLAPDKMLVSKPIEHDGKKTDVDLAFVFERILFVVDCKATAKDAGYYDGATNKWRNRLGTYLEELEDKCPRRADFLAHGAKRAIIAPEDFDAVVSLVCTATVEYLPLDQPSFWRGEHATVGPPEELLDLVRALAGGG